MQLEIGFGYSRMSSTLDVNDNNTKLLSALRLEPWRGILWNDFLSICKKALLDES